MHNSCTSCTNTCILSELRCIGVPAVDFSSSGVYVPANRQVENSPLVIASCSDSGNCLWPKATSCAFTCSMKRSQAPSRRKLAFKPPRALGAIGSANAATAGVARLPSTLECAASSAVPAPSVDAVVASFPAVSSQKRPTVVNRGFKRPLQSSNSALHNRPAKLPAKSTPKSAAPASAPSSGSYFNVMYTKDPYTKKRRRMSDGVLSLNGRQAELYDDAGKSHCKQIA